MHLRQQCALARENLLTCTQVLLGDDSFGSKKAAIFLAGFLISKRRQEANIATTKQLLVEKLLRIRRKRRKTFHALMHHSEVTSQVTMLSNNETTHDLQTHTKSVFQDLTTPSTESVLGRHHVLAHVRPCGLPEFLDLSNSGVS